MNIMLISCNKLIKNKKIEFSKLKLFGSEKDYVQILAESSKKSFL